jgi:hypothetical protein
MGILKSYLLAFFFIVPYFALGQNGWVTVSVQTDQYAGETSWKIFSALSGEIIETSDPFISNSLTETVVTLSVGSYLFAIYDTYGDGICCNFGEGWFGLSNTCGLDEYVYDFNSALITIPFVVDPCEIPIYGCMDDKALNYNPWAIYPAPCDLPPIPCPEGQTNIISLLAADTYFEEISWDISVYGTEEILAWGGNYTGAQYTNTSSVCADIGDSLVATIYDTYGDGLCGSCWGGTDGHFVVLTPCGDIFFNVYGEQYDTLVSPVFVVPYCDPPLSSGCMDSDYMEYNPSVLEDDGSCLTPIIWGCTDDTAFNYDSEANGMELEETCGYTLSLTDGGYDGWFGSWIGVTQGEDLYGPYEMLPENTFQLDIPLDLRSNEEVNVYFFTGGNAANTAGQCGFSLSGPQGMLLQAGTNPWTDAILEFPYKYTTVASCDNFCEPYIYGCMDTTAQNYDVEVNSEDGSCYYNAGCMQAGYVEYYEQGYVADFDDGSCATVAMFGCTDPEALNYDLEANVDIDSCIDVMVGCVDVNAFNYDNTANTADNSLCLYDAGCVGEAGDPYWANDACYSWVIDVDPNCCGSEWDAICVEMYSYCEAGMPTDIPFYLNDLQIYPNPASNTLTIRCPYNVITAVYNNLGQQVVSSTTEKVLDLSGLSKGLYQVIVEYNGIIINKKIMKL